MRFSLRLPRTPGDHRTGRRTVVNRSRAAAAAAAAGLLALLPGCGLQSGNTIAADVSPGSIGRGRPLDGAHLTVTSKEFTEQLVLGEIAGLALKAAGATVTDKTDIQGSIGARQAMTRHVADVMFEYTGTAWITYLGHTAPVASPAKQWRVVRDADRAHGLTWLPPSTLNNTYAFAVNRKTKEKYHLSTTSQLAELMRKDPAARTVCIEPEFASRTDGWPGAKKAYGLKVPVKGQRIMQAGLVYRQLAKGGACTAGEVFTTDGRLPNLHLTALRDDRHFFPNYDAAPVVRTAALKKYPAIAKVLGPIAERLDNATAQRLNGEVDVRGREPRDVAEEWLVKEGFVKRGG